LDDGFACGFGQGTGGRKRGGRGASVGCQFDQFHRGGRVEEVQRKDAVGVLGRAGDGGHGDGRGVGGKDRIRRKDGFKLGKQRLLGVGALYNRLDDQIAGGETGKRVNHPQGRQGGVAVSFGEFACGHAGGQTFGHPRAGCVAGRGMGVGGDGGKSCRRKDLRDAKAHGAKADHSDGGHHSPL
jgi:hypothetical protein